MTNQTKIIVGIDVSKDKLDIYCKDSNEHFIVENSVDGLDRMNQFFAAHKYQYKDIWIAFELTGIYHKALEAYCATHFYTYFALNALDLKRSMGLVRGKNDKVDSIRIAQYVHEKRDTLQPSERNHPVIDELKDYMSLRDLLVADRGKYQARMSEQIKVGKIDKTDIRIKSQQEIIETLSAQIEKVEQKIKELLTENSQIAENFELVSSIVGVGLVVATQILIDTNNFQKFNDPRKFACYCGIAPFGQSSGKYQGKTKISPLGKKKLKALLDLSARVAIQYDLELQSYYEKKLAEGKHKKSIRNVVRNKIVHRIFAVIRKKSTFIRKIKKISAH